MKSNKILKKIHEEKLNFAFMNPEELEVNYGSSDESGVNNIVL